MNTIYQETEDGGIALKAGRRAWGVDIPAYVYDLWMPLIGSDAVAIYGVLWRLAINGKTKKASIKQLATACRKGDKTLTAIFNLLAECGFIEIQKPVSWQKLAKFTTTYVVLDPPRKVDPVLIEKYKHPSGYSPLSKWLLQSLGDDTDLSLGDDANIDPSNDPLKDIAGFSEKPASQKPVRDWRGNVPEKVESTAPSTGNEKYVYSNLETFLLKALNLREVAASHRSKLREEVPVLQVTGERELHPSPITQYDKDALYKKFVEEKVSYMFNASGGKGVGNIINTISNYALAGGWLVYQKKHTAPATPVFEEKAPVIAAGIPRRKN